MSKNRIISVIIPVYNVEHLLERCLNSVIQQAYKDLQIILVNDGSTDKSPEICDNYLKIDDRIKVIHKKNEGPNAARKDGVNIANGEYIAFVDSDDYIDKNMFEVLVNEASKGVDVVQCGYRKVSTAGEVLSTITLKPIDISQTSEIALYYASQKNTTNFLWNKLYRAEIFKNIEFPSFFAGEDSCILTQVYAFSRRTVNIKNPLYNYVMTPNSLCRQPFSLKKLDNIDAGKFMFEFNMKHFPQLSGFSALHICSYAARLYCELINSDIITKKKYLKVMVENFMKYYMLTKDNMVRKRSSIKRICLVELFRKSPRICSCVYKYLV